MATTDVLLIITIMLLVCVTVVNVRKSCGADVRARRLCDQFKNPYGYPEDSFIDGVHDKPDALEEMTNHPAKRGLVPRIKQPQHTENMWKSAYSQAEADDRGVRNTTFSSDLLTPYRNEYKLRSVNPKHIEVRHPNADDTVWEPFKAGPIEGCSNPLGRYT